MRRSRRSSCCDSRRPPRSHFTTHNALRVYTLSLCVLRARARQKRADGKTRGRRRGSVSEIRSCLRRFRIYPNSLSSREQRAGAEARGAARAQVEGDARPLPRSERAARTARGVCRPRHALAVVRRELAAHRALDKLLWLQRVDRHTRRRPSLSLSLSASTCEKHARTFLAYSLLLVVAVAVDSSHTVTRSA